MGGVAGKEEAPTGPFNVYGQAIDETNRMPKNPNQRPQPEQKAPLSTARVESSIPKGGTDGTWTYPSPQMFFNALQRKKKGDGVVEADMEVVIAVHNNVNERTWRQLLQWENQIGPGGRLLKFVGKPHDISPKARLKQLLGYGLPFDRHDWFIQRGDTIQRYVIDFYHVEANSSMDQIPGLHDTDAVRSIDVDVRPAIDDVSSLLLRLKNSFQRTGRTLIQDKSPEDVEAGREVIQKAIKPQDEDVLRFLNERCAGQVAALVECKKEDCSKEYIGANFCLGSILCPSLSQKLLAALKDREGDAEAVLQEMSMCIQNSGIAQKMLALNPPEEK